MGLIDRLKNNLIGDLKKGEDSPEDFTHPYHRGTVKIHNFTCSTKTWGHDISTTPSDNGKVMSFIGHTSDNPCVGDIILLTSRNGIKGSARYRITELQWLRDPCDMYSGNAVFVIGRTGPQYENDKNGILKGLPVWTEGEESWKCSEVKAP
jgi:hypothetical protein